MRTIKPSTVPLVFYLVKLLCVSAPFHWCERLSRRDTRLSHQVYMSFLLSFPWFEGWGSAVLGLGPHLWVSIVGPHGVTPPGEKEEREGQTGEENTCLTRLSSKEIRFQWKATINLDTGTQVLIALIPRCPVCSEAGAKNPPPPVQTSARPLRSGPPVSGLIVSTGATKMFANNMRIPLDRVLPEISFKKFHKIRGCQVHTSRHLCRWRGGPLRNFSEGRKSSDLQGAIRLVLDLLWSAF